MTTRLLAHVQGLSEAILERFGDVGAVVIAVLFVWVCLAVIWLIALVVIGAMDWRARQRRQAPPTSGRRRVS